MECMGDSEVFHDKQNSLEKTKTHGLTIKHYVPQSENKVSGQITPSCFVVGGNMKQASRFDQGYYKCDGSHLAQEYPKYEGGSSRVEATQVETGKEKEELATRVRVEATSMKVCSTKVD